jgi:hypothetical protein
MYLPGQARQCAETFLAMEKHAAAVGDLAFSFKQARLACSEGRGHRLTEQRA